MKFDSMKYWNIEVLTSQAVWKWKQQAKPFFCVLMPIIILTGSEALVDPLMFLLTLFSFSGQLGAMAGGHSRMGCLPEALKWESAMRTIFGFLFFLWGSILWGWSEPCWV